ncbi:hypothetical protein Tco_0159520, partial [Tanacetum coccineum]
DDEAEITSPYEETDPANKPPPDSDEESKFAPPVRPVIDANHELIPPIIQFDRNYHVGESLLIGTLLTGIPKMFGPAPRGGDLNSVNKRMYKLEKRMFDRYTVETRMAKKLKGDDLRMNRNEYDISELDEAVREQRSDYS